MGVTLAFLLPPFRHYSISRWQKKSNPLAKSFGCGIIIRGAGPLWKPVRPRRIPISYGRQESSAPSIKARQLIKPPGLLTL